MRKSLRARRFGLREATHPRGHDLHEAASSRAAAIEPPNESSVDQNPIPSPEINCLGRAIGVRPDGYGQGKDPLAFFGDRDPKLGHFIPRWEGATHRLRADRPRQDHDIHRNHAIDLPP